jgi:RimJ/RimL family protein N-acetyltransferase
MILCENEIVQLIYFRKVDIGDRNYQSWFNDPDVSKFNSHGLFPYTPNDQNAFGNLVEENFNSKTPNAITLKIYGSIPGNMGLCWSWVGNISLQSINWINRSAEFAIVVGDTRYWGKGYGYEAAKLLFNHGFNKLNLHRIWTGTAETNTGMRKLAEKLRMLEEGKFTDGMFLNGEYVDIITYRSLQKEFEKGD